MMPKFSALLLSTLLGFHLPAYSQTAPRAEEPDTLILSDQLDYDDTKRESIFTGNVTMTRGLMTLNADQLVMREDAKGFQQGSATVTTAPHVIVRQENPEQFEVIVAQGLRAEYNSQTEEIHLINRASVTKYICGKPFDTISGERIKYRQKDNTYQAIGGPQSAAADGRVRSLAAPSARAQAAFEDCQKKQAEKQNP